MHETLNPEVKGYLDVFEKVSEGIRIRGWCFHTQLGILPLRFLVNDDSYMIPIPEERNDVATFYSNDAVKECGWSATVPNGSFLEGNINGAWVPIFHINIATVNIDLSPYVFPSFVVVDNFYADPDSVRKYALNQKFIEHKAYHKGARTDEVYRFPGLKERFERILGCKIRNWEHYGTNGCFQYCIAGDQLVYHCDEQEYAGVLYLTPDAPAQTGTQLFRSRYTNTMKPAFGTQEYNKTFPNGFLDPTQFEMIDTVGNVYNRLILFDARTIHAATEYFGTNKENGRLFQLFFFDVEK